jgi:hypothetical protein
MSIGCRLLTEANAAGLLLSRRGEHIHIDSPLGRPLPEDLRERLLAHRAQVLAWLDWCSATDELLLAMSGRLAMCPGGAALDEAAWHAADEAMQRAHHSQDMRVFRTALADYERFAREQLSRSREGEER